MPKRAQDGTKKIMQNCGKPMVGHPICWPSQRWFASSSQVFDTLHKSYQALLNGGINSMSLFIPLQMVKQGINHTALPFS